MVLSVRTEKRVTTETEERSGAFKKIIKNSAKGKKNSAGKSNFLLLGERQTSESHLLQETELPGGKKMEISG